MEVTGTTNFIKLREHILELSKAETFEEARHEWRLTDVVVSAEYSSCPCGQQIKEHCYITNSVTDSTTYVGNVCVNRFFGIDTGTLFEGLKRIRANPEANANLAVIEYAEARGYIFEREGPFLRETLRKRKLSVKQVAWKAKINNRILAATIVQKRQGE